MFLKNVVMNFSLVSSYRLHEERAERTGIVGNFPDLRMLLHVKSKTLGYNQTPTKVADDYALRIADILRRMIVSAVHEEIAVGG